MSRKFYNELYCKICARKLIFGNEKSQIDDNKFIELHKKYIENQDKSNQKSRKLTEYEEIQIENYFLKRLSQRIGLKVSILRKYPELIENYRQQIKVKQLLKSKQNGNN